MRVCQVCDREYEDSVTVCPDDGGATAAKGSFKKKSDEDPLIGRMVGSYKLTKVLGKGGMGAVYAAEHPAIGSKVAVKFLHSQYAQDKGLVSRFFNEAKAVNLIKHDNIVAVLDYTYLDETTPCFVMEFLDQGYSMSKLAGTPQPLEVSGPIFIQVCDALAAAHDKQIIHRDLKPDNIFLSVKNHRKHFVKLMDFGIAKLAAGGEDQSKTQTGMVMGTPAYMSPEQASGKVNEIGPASDIYSLGIIMYLMATGTVPFKGAWGEIMAGHLFNEVRKPRELVPEVPAQWEAVILKCLAKKAEDRYPNMRALIGDISKVMTELGVSMELPPDDTAGAHGGASGPITSMTSGVRAAAAAATRSQTNPPAIANEATRIGTSAPGGAQNAATVLPSMAAKPQAGSSGRRIAIMAVAFVLGVAAPIGLVRSGLVGPSKQHAAR